MKAIWSLAMALSLSCPVLHGQHTFPVDRSETQSHETGGEIENEGSADVEMRGRNIMPNPELTQCIVRNMGTPHDANLRVCHQKVKEHLDDFVGVCKVENFDACLEAVTDTIKKIGPVCGTNPSYLKRAILFCILR